MDNQAGLLSPPGELAMVHGRRIHWRRWGTPTDLPPVILECGLTMMSSCWGWIAPELGRYTEVMAYDRAGLGWSEEREGIREAVAIRSELIGLLETIGFARPWVLAGHSMGALLHRALALEKPDWCRAFIFLDPAHHRQMSWNRSVRRRMRNFFLLLEGINLLASRGLPTVTLPLEAAAHHLPEPDRQHLLSWFRNPRHLRTTVREARAWQETSHLVESSQLASIPLLILSAQKHPLPGWEEMQHDLLSLSSDSQQVTFTDASHLSMLTQRDHALRTVEAMIRFIQSIA